MNDFVDNFDIPSEMSFVRLVLVKYTFL